MMTSSKAWFDAVQKGDIKMVRFLLQNNARSYDDLGETALMRSVRLFDRQLVQLLLDHEAGVISRDGSTALSIAATMGNAVACELLYAREAKLGLQNKRTPLILAAQAGHLKCVQILKDNDPAHRDAFNRSALDYAIQSGHSSIVNYLVGLPPVKEHCLNQAIMVSRHLRNDLLAERLIELRDRFSKTKLESSNFAKRGTSKSSKYHTESFPPNVISEYAPELMGASSSSANTPTMDPTLSSVNSRASTTRAHYLAGLIPKSSSSMRIQPQSTMNSTPSCISALNFGSSAAPITRQPSRDSEDKGRFVTRPGSETLKENVIELLFRRLQHNTEEIECLRRQIQVMKSLPISRSVTPADRRTTSRQREGPVSRKDEKRYYVQENNNDFMLNYQEDKLVNNHMQQIDDYNPNISNFGDSDGFNAGTLREACFPNTIIHNKNYILSPANAGNDCIFGDQQFTNTRLSSEQNDIGDNPSLPQVGDSAFSAFADTQKDAAPFAKTDQFNDTKNYQRETPSNVITYPNIMDAVDQSLSAPLFMEQSYPAVSDSFRFATPQLKDSGRNDASNNLATNMIETVGDSDEMLQSYTEEEILNSNSDLMNAVLSNDLDSVMALIPTQAGLQNIVGKTALMYAIEESFSSAANALLNYEVGYSDTVGITALMIAARVSNLDLIQKLISEEACMRSLGGRTALMLAARCNQPHSAAMLLDTEGTLVDEGGYSALHIAAVHNHTEVASILVGKEAGIKTRDGRTALMLAIEKDSLETANVILPHECNITDNDDYTCLMQVAEVTDNPSIAQLLVAFEGGFVNSNGLMALEVAIRCHNYKVADVLVPEEGVSIMQYQGSSNDFQRHGRNDNESDQYTELMQACDQGDIVAVYCFKDQYYSSNVNGVTPLEIARKRGYTDIVTLLCELFEEIPDLGSEEYTNSNREMPHKETRDAYENGNSEDGDEYIPPAGGSFCEDSRRDSHANPRRSVQRLATRESLELYDSDIAGSENSYHSVSFTSGTSNEKISKTSSAYNSISGASSRHSSGNVLSRGSGQSHNAVLIQNVQETSKDHVPAPMPARHSFHGMQHRLEPTVPDETKQRHVMADTVTRQFSTLLSSKKPSFTSNTGPSNHSSNAPSANTSLFATNISNLTVNSPASFIAPSNSIENTSFPAPPRPPNVYERSNISQSIAGDSAPNSTNAFASIEQHHLRVLGNAPTSSEQPLEQASSLSILTDNSTTQSTTGTEKRHRSAQNLNKNSELMQAIINGDSVQAAELVSSQAGLVNRLKQTALMIACEKNNTGIASMLMEQESGQTCTSYEMNYWKMAPATALMIAAMNGNIDCVQLLVGLEKRMKDNIGKTALMAGAFCGHLHVVRFLVEHEKCMQTRFGTTALMIATRENQIETVRELLPHEHSIVDMNGFTALMIACERGFNECASILAEKEIGVVVRTCPVTGEQWTGLAFAIASGNLNCIRELARYEAPEYGETALRALTNSKVYSAEQRVEIESTIKKHMNI